MSCFRQANSSQPGSTSNVDGPCNAATAAGSFSPCCPLKVDSRNLCLSEYLCWEANPPPGGTGFLTASCTDDTYDSSACNQHCADNAVPDITYDRATGLWACCSWTYAGGVDCNNPTNETWSAPAPSVLLAAASSASSIYPSSTASKTRSTAGSTATTGSTTTSSATSAGTSPSATATSSSSHSGLSTGAEAGIGIGAAIAVIALLILAFLFGKRQRQAKRYPAPEESYPLSQPHHNSHSGGGGFRSEQKYGYKDAPPPPPPPVETYGHAVHEVSAEQVPYQGGNHGQPYELH